MKKTQKALFASALSLLLCISMLLGTTFAWFTDSVTSGKNKIEAGNLDIDVEYSKDMANWASIEEKTDLFSDVTLWEPGATSVVYLKIINKGTLALKYNLSIQIESETNGTNVNDESFKLSDYIKFGQVEDVTAVYASREAARDAVSSDAENISTGYALPGTMLKGTEKYLALVVYMPEEVGNAANYKTGTDIPTIEMGVKIKATQYTEEGDSFDKYYDLAAEVLEEPTIAKFSVYTADEFTEAVKQAESREAIEIMKAGLELTVAYDTDKVLLLKGADIEKLTANIPNGTIHVWNEVNTVIGTNVDIENSAHFYKKVTTLDAKAGHFVIEAGATVDTVNALPASGKNAKELNIEIKGNAGTVNAPENVPEKAVEIKVSGGGTVDKLEVPVADLNIAVKVEENAKVSELNFAEGEENKIVLQNNGTIENEADIADNTQLYANIDEANKIVTVMNADDLRTFAASANAGENYEDWTIKLGADIDLANKPWTPIGNGDNFDFSFKLFDGQNHTVSNLYVNAPEGNNAGLFGTFRGGNIQNLTVENANILARDYVGVIAGTVYGTVIDNCTVKNAVVRAMPYTVSEGKYDGGAKAGAFVGYLTAQTTAEVKNSKAENVVVIAYRDLGGIAGYAQGDAKIENCEVKNISLVYDNQTVVGTYDGGKQNENRDTFAGRKDSTFVNSGNSSSNVASYTLDKVIFLSKASDIFDLSSNVNRGITLEGMLVVLTNDIDMENKTMSPIGNYTDNKAFMGTFEGLNHTVSNLKVYSNGKKGVGFFGKVYAPCIIRNLHLENVNVTGEGTNTYTGGLVGHGYAKIDNCSFSGEVHGGNQMGGIAASGGFTITNCEFKGTIYGKYWGLGGIIGNCQDGGAISGNKASGKIVGVFNDGTDHLFVGGGIIGCAIYTTYDVKDNYSDMEISYNGEAVTSYPIMGIYNIDEDDVGTGEFDFAVLPDKVSGNSWNTAIYTEESYQILYNTEVPAESGYSIYADGSVVSDAVE